MKVVVVEFLGRGGMIHYAFQLCRALARRGVEPVLVTDRRYELDALDGGFRVVQLFDLWDPKPVSGPAVDGRPGGRILRKLRRLARAPRHALAWWRLARFVRRERPDLVQLGDVRFAADLAGLWLLRRAGAGLIDICHNVRPFALGGAAAGTFRRSRIERALYRRAYSLFDVVFVHGAANRSRFLETYDADPERVVAIPMGNAEIFRELADSPDARAAELRRRLDLGDSRVVLLFGTLSRYKGVDLLLQAFARVAGTAAGAGTTLVIAGFPLPDFDVEAHRRMAERLRIGDRVRFAPGYVESPAVAAWMRLAEIVVLPYREGYQSAVLRTAQTFARPLIVAAAGSLAEMVDDGDNGLLVSPGDREALAGALTRVLGDRLLAGRLAEGARRVATTRFAWEHVADAWIRACDAALRSQPARGAAKASGKVNRESGAQSGVADPSAAHAGTADRSAAHPGGGR